MKICFITSLYSDNSNNLEKPGKFTKDNRYDYYLFTNISRKKFNTSWIVINYLIPEVDNYVRKSRYVKFMIWKYFQQLDINYDIIFYCDAFLRPNLDECTKYFNKINLYNFGIYQIYHHINGGKGGIIQECNRIIVTGKVSKDEVKKGIENLKKIDSNVNLESNYLFENTFFGYNPKNFITTSFFEQFWNYYVTNKYTIRDQPLYNFLLIKNNIIPGLLNRNTFKVSTKIIGHNSKNYKKKMIKKITLCLSYYNQSKDVLKKHLNYFNLFDDFVKDQFYISIIDDCSKIPIDDLIKNDEELNNLYLKNKSQIKLYRIEKDLYCNIAGVRNLAFNQCITKWAVILDMDTLVNPILAEQMLQIINQVEFNKNEHRTIYKFNRKVINDEKHKKHNSPHPAVCLIQKKHYDEVGGCEEDLVGNYGYTDPGFWHRVLSCKNQLKIKTHHDKYVEYIPEGEADIVRNTTHNSKIYLDRINNNNWSKNKLRFDWHIIESITKIS